MTSEFKFKVRELQAAALFASTEDNRAALQGVHVDVKRNRVLFVATDGRHVVFIKSVCNATDKTVTAKLTIPLSYIAQLPLDDEGTGNASEWIASYDSESLQLRIASGDSREFSTACEPAEYFPKWRQVVPKEKQSSVGTFFGIDLCVFEKFSAAARILEPNKPPFAQIAHNSEFSGRACEIRLTHYPNLFGLASKVTSPSDLPGRPDWLH
jgi:hypothetical protein